MVETAFHIKLAPCVAVGLDQGALSLGDLAVGVVFIRRFHRARGGVGDPDHRALTVGVHGVFVTRTDAAGRGVVLEPDGFIDAVGRRPAAGKNAVLVMQCDVIESVGICVTWG